MPKLVFTTLIGSHLHGTNHAGSDVDILMVFDGKDKPRHIKSNKNDIIHVGIYELLRLAHAAAPQFVEGTFSLQKNWYNKAFEPVVENFRLPQAQARKNYEGLITSLCYGDEKERRHAVRLNYFLAELGDNDGVANPRMSETQIHMSKLAAQHLYGKELLEALLPDALVLL